MTVASSLGQYYFEVQYRSSLGNVRLVESTAVPFSATELSEPEGARRRMIVILCLH